MFWTNLLTECLHLRIKINSLAVLCNHPESDVCCFWQVDDSVSGYSNPTNLLRHFP